MRPSLLAAGIVWIFSATASANAVPLEVEVEDAADHHVSAQGTFINGLPDSWEYLFGSKRSAPNITGITAHGLIAAHRLTGLQQHQQSAVKAAKALIWAYDEGWKKHRPYTQDIEFLAAAGFIIDAGRWFNVTRGRYTPAAYVDYVMQGRKASPTVVGWDIASAIRAAIAVGQPRYAAGMLDELVRRQAEWDRAGAGRQLSRGSLLWAMAELKARAGLSGDHQRVADGLLRAVVADQQRNGAWLDTQGGAICTQTTAYAVLGLTRWSAGKAAAARGRTWLVKSALADQRYFAGGRIWATTYTTGGRPANNFVSEIQSEAMMALATGK